MTEQDLRSAVETADALIITATEALETAETVLSEKQKTLTELEDSYDIAAKEYDDANAALNDASEEDAETAKSMVGVADEARAEAKLRLTNIQGEVSECQTAIELATEAVTDAKTMASEAAQKYDAFRAETDATAEAASKIEDAADTADTEETAEEEVGADDTVEIGGIRTSFTGYALSMAANVPVTNADVALKQGQLVRMIETLLSVSNEGFKEAMLVVIDIIREHRKGAFAELRVFRHWGTLKVPQAKLEKVAAVINLLLSTADAESRVDVAKTVDFEVVGRHFNNDDEKNKLFGFYKS